MFLSQHSHLDGTESSHILLFLLQAFFLARKLALMVLAWKLLLLVQGVVVMIAIRGLL